MFGVVQFDPREGNAGGKPVRNIVIREVGFTKPLRVSATLWPSHDHVAVAKGDVVVVDGSATQTKGEGQNGPVTYNNLSVSQIKVFGSTDSGKRVETVNTADATEDDEEIPF